MPVEVLLSGIVEMQDEIRRNFTVQDVGLLGVLGILHRCSSLQIKIAVYK